MTLALRPLARADLPLVDRWFRAPHAAPWFGSRDVAYLEDVLAGAEPIHAFIVTWDGEPIGFVEWSRFGDFPEMARNYEVTDPDAANCDILLGEERFTGRGLGPALVEMLLFQQIFADPRVTTCVIDPHEANVRAIRAYEKAGFRFVRRVIDDEDGVPLHLMERHRSP